MSPPPSTSPAERSPTRSSLSPVGVVGGGFMGTGIAESVARAGIETVVFEPTAEGRERALARLDRSVARAVEAGKLDGDSAGALHARVALTGDFADLAPCGLAIEAVPENEALKRQVFADLDAVTRDDAVLASNTSSIPIAQLAAATSRPELVVGLHFFSPVPVMRLVEIVVALDTSAQTLERARAFADAIGKTPVVTKDRSGFIVNMLLVPYLMAAVRMYDEGFASREDIDTGMRLGCGHPMGPLTLCDFIGLDVLYAVCGSLYEEFKRDEYAPPPLMKRMVVAGHHGRKTGRGFYEYR